MRRLFLIAALCAPVWGQSSIIGGAKIVGSVSSVPAGPTVSLYDIYPITFSATTSGVNTAYLQDLTTFTSTWTAPGGSCVRGDGVTVTSLTILGYVETSSAAVANWKANANLPCVGVWTYTSTATDGTTNWNTGTTPATPSGSVTVTASTANDGFLRVSGLRFIGERTSTAVALFGAAMNGGHATIPSHWNCGGCGVAGADIDATALSTTYFPALGNDGLRIFRHGVASNQNLISSFSDDGAGHNRYDATKSLSTDDDMSVLHSNRMHLLKMFEDCSSSSFATSGAGYTAIKNGIRHTVARFGAYADFWEICNESNGITQSFITAIKAYVASIDPYGHPVTTSYVGQVAPAGITGIDFTSPHIYTNAAVGSFYSSIAASIAAELTNNPALPVLPGEGGNLTSTGTTNLANSSDDPYRFLGFISVETITGAGSIVWDTSYNHPVSFGNGTLSNMYIGLNAKAAALNLYTFWSGHNKLDASISTTQSSNLACYVAATASGNADMIGMCADTTSFTASHASGTVTLVVPSAGMTVSWLDPTTGTTLGTATPSSGSQTLSIPTFTGTAIMRACIHGTSGCQL